MWDAWRVVCALPYDKQATAKDRIKSSFRIDPPGKIGIAPERPFANCLGGYAQ